MSNLIPASPMASNFFDSPTVSKADLGPVELECTVEEVHVRRGDWMVATAKDDKDRFFSIVGTLASVAAGDNLHVVGEFVEHSRWGIQLTVKGYTATIPETEEGAKRWLNDRLPWVGPKRAAMLVKKFGLPKLWHIIEGSSAELVAIPGITEERAQELHEVYMACKYEREFYAWLYSLGLPESLVGAAVTRWGQQVKERVTEDPYCLMALPRPRFDLIDVVARKEFGVDLLDSRRLTAGLEASFLAEAKQEGHTHVLATQVLFTACAVLGVANQNMLADLLAHAKRLLVLRTLRDGIWVTLLRYDEAETNIVAFVMNNAVTRSLFDEDY